MVTVELLSGLTPPEQISYVVIAARKDGGWLFVKHRERGGYEMPAGHPEKGESSEEAAVRELSEETGALTFIIEPVTYYCVSSSSGKKYGRLFFAEVETMGIISDTAEVESVRVFRKLPRKVSLPEVMSALFRTAEEYFRYSRC